jgi:hypothetical protein
MIGQPQGDHPARIEVGPDRTWRVQRKKLVHEYNLKLPPFRWSTGAGIRKLKRVIGVPIRSATGSQNQQRNEE